jgi:hypothetical protein
MASLMFVGRFWLEVQYVELPNTMSVLPDVVFGTKLFVFDATNLPPWFNSLGA